MAVAIFVFIPAGPAAGTGTDSTSSRTFHYQGLQPQVVAYHVHTSNSACIEIEFEMNSSTRAPYSASYVFIALDRAEYQKLYPAFPSDEPLSTERFLRAGGLSFAAGYNESTAHRTMFNASGAIRSDESEGMENTTDPFTFYHGAYAETDCEEIFLQTYDETDWYIYAADVRGISNVTISAYESLSTWPRAGRATINGVEGSTSQILHVSQPYQWSGLYDEESRSGTLGALLTKTVTTKHALVGSLTTPNEDMVMSYLSPSGRIGGTPFNDYGLAFAGGRQDGFWVYGNESGDWRFDIQAHHSDSWAQSALLWADVEEPTTTV